MKRLVAALLLIVVAFSMCACQKQETELLSEEDVRAICDLATLECYYNNVAKIYKEAANIFLKDRTMWIEYEGKATIGIDMSEVVISIKGENVEIQLPEAKILSSDYTFMEDSYVASEDGFWIFSNKISTEEQQAGVVEGQKAMLEAVSNNQALFIKAQERAKELIENYIENIGKATGKEYTIQWVEKSET